MNIQIRSYTVKFYSEELSGIAGDYETMKNWLMDKHRLSEKAACKELDNCSS